MCEGLGVQKRNRLISKRLTDLILFPPNPLPAPSRFVFINQASLGFGASPSPQAHRFSMVHRFLRLKRK